MAKKSRSTIGEDPLDALVPFDGDEKYAEDLGQERAGIAEEHRALETPEIATVERSAAMPATSRARSKKARRAAARRADEQTTSDSPDPAGIEAHPAQSAPPQAESDAAPGPMTTEATRDMERINRELQVRIRELEFELARDTQGDEGVGADDTEASVESGSIIAVIKDLHAEIEAGCELKEALEADLAAVKNKLSAEESVRTELEARIKLLEAKAALGDQLREDISFVEEERNETARRLEQVTSQVEELAEERDTLAEQKAVDEARIKEVQNDRISLEAKVLNLEETVAEMDRLRDELAEARDNAQRFEENAQNIKGKLEATEVAKNALDLDLTTTRELLRNQSEQIDELKDELADTRTQIADLRAQADRQEIENVNLVEVRRRGEREIKTLTARVESVKKELDASKKALRDIRSAAVRTTERVRERHS